MSLKKSFLKTKSVCKVTFRLSAKEANGAESVQLIGDFNSWDESTQPMKRLKNGDFTQSINLTSDSTYQFRYLKDGTEWENDWNADAYEPNGIPGESNSVVSV